MPMEILARRKVTRSSSGRASVSLGGGPLRPVGPLRPFIIGSFFRQADIDQGLLRDQDFGNCNVGIGGAVRRGER